MLAFYNSIPGPDPDLSVLGGGGGGSNWARGQGGLSQVVGPGQSPGGGFWGGDPTENDFLCLTYLWRALLDSML